MLGELLDAIQETSSTYIFESTADLKTKKLTKADQALRAKEFIESKIGTDVKSGLLCTRVKSEFGSLAGLDLVMRIDRFDPEFCFDAMQDVHYHYRSKGKDNTSEEIAKQLLEHLRRGRSLADVFFPTKEGNGLRKTSLRWAEFRRAYPHIAPNADTVGEFYNAISGPKGLWGPMYVRRLFGHIAPEARVFTSLEYEKDGEVIGDIDLAICGEEEAILYVFNHSGYFTPIKLTKKVKSKSDRVPRVLRLEK